MKPVSLYLIILFSICFINSSCEKKDDPIDPNGGTPKFARYVGEITGNDCIDKLTLINDTSQTIGQFMLLVEFPANQVWDVMSSHALKVSENEYYSSTIAPLCHLNGEYRYANLHFIVEPDSVWMNLRFWELGGESGIFVDSTHMVFRRF